MRWTANAVFPAAPARRSSSLGSFLIVLVLLTLATHAVASVIVVDQTGGGDYLTVQEGVDAASHQDTVQVMAGFYTERVVVDGKCLTFEGSGPSGTAIFWDGADVTLEFLNTPSPYRSYVHNINIAHSFDTTPGGRTGDRQVHTVQWAGSTVVFDGAVINGGAIGRTYFHVVHTGIESYQSTFDWVIVSGDRRSIIEESFVFEAAEFTGWYEDHVTMGSIPVESSDSWYNELELPMLVTYSAVGDSVQTLRVSGGLPVSPEVTLSECGIGDAVLADDNVVRFYSCVVNGISFIDNGTYLIMEGCLVGQFDLIAYSGLYRLLHNTFDGWFYYEVGECMAPSAIRSNIFTDYTAINDGSSGSPRLPATHNLFEHTQSNVLALPDSLFTNIWQEDARFCPGEYTIEDCSPCIGHAHDGGIIGAFGIGCDCTLVNAVEERSWGAIKALYR